MLHGPFLMKIPQSLKINNFLISKVNLKLFHIWILGALVHRKITISNTFKNLYFSQFLKSICTVLLSLGVYQRWDQMSRRRKRPLSIDQTRRDPCLLQHIPQTWLSVIVMRMNSQIIRTPSDIIVKAKLACYVQGLTVAWETKMWANR